MRDVETFPKATDRRWATPPYAARRRRTRFPRFYTAKNNLLNTAYSEAYTYDQLNRLANTTRNGVPYQNWVLGALGNSGVAQARTFNSQNQVTAITGTGATPLYDPNGNITTDQTAITIENYWQRIKALDKQADRIDKDISGIQDAIRAKR